MAKKDYRVVPQGEGWAVKLEGAERASSLHETQRDAIQGGKRLAQANKTEVVIHRSNGQIRDSDSYGNDPVPPKDMKHCLSVLPSLLLFGQRTAEVVDLHTLVVPGPTASNGPCHHSHGYISDEASSAIATIPYRSLKFSMTSDLLSC